MPELPEVETLKRSLEAALIGQRIQAIQIKRADLIKRPDAESFARTLSGKQIVALGRRGKFLLIHIEDGAKLVVHLRMTGRLVCSDPEQPELPHTHLCFELENGRVLRYSDTRRFGCLWLVAPGEEDDFTGLAKLGREPLDAAFSGDYLWESLAKRRIKVKQGLLDQSVIAGLGNIYVDEALYQAGVRPDRLCTDISTEEWQSLAEAIPPILNSSIQHRGTSFSDYLDGEGKKGDNLAFLKAYQREGQPCERCGTLLEKIRVGGRGSCFCPKCQK